MVILNDTLGAVGGSHTLFLRMCEWYRKQGIAVSFFCNNRDNEEISKQLEKMGVSIFVVDTSDMKKTFHLLRSIDDGEMRVINFWSNKYLDIEAIKYKYKLELENVVYLIHPKCLIKGDSYKRGGLFIRVIKEAYKNIIPQMCSNSSIVSMDEINIRETEEYYSLKMSPRPPIIRLPMTIEPVNKDKVIQEGYASKVIMTSCRADFPYKGYVVGLIDEFLDLKRNYSDIQLYIVCDGEDIGILKEKIRQVPQDVQESIRLSGWMSYEELKEKMNSCMLYIGMGSSVLDSSLRYKPSAVIQFFTMECLGKDYTADNPYDLAAKEDIKERASVMIRRVLDMPFNEYKGFSEKSYKAISEMYGVDSVMKQFVSHHISDNMTVLKRKDYCLVRMNNRINSIRFRRQKEKSSVVHLTKSGS